MAADGNTKAAKTPVQVARELTGAASQAPPKPDPAEQLKRAPRMPRHEVRRVALELGADEAKADRVAEAVVRRTQAREEGRMFLYIDVENELEDLYRVRKASPEAIANAKQRVWTAAREISDQRELPIEEALFFCYHEAVAVFTESINAETAGAV
jgi:hypothetical protein